MRKTKWIADGNDGFTDHQIFAAAHFDRRQRIFGVNAQYGQVKVRIGTDDIRFKLPFVLKDDLDGSFLGNHVRVGKDQAPLAVDDHTGAQRAPSGLALEIRIKKIPEKRIKERIQPNVRRGFPALAGHGHRAYIYHRRAGAANSSDDRGFADVGLGAMRCGYG